MDQILTQEMIDASLKKLSVSWTAIGNDYLVRTFQTEDFSQGVSLVNDLAKVAEECDHHPEITLTYNRVEVRVSTHSVAGITEKDFDFAHKVDETVDVAE